MSFSFLLIYDNGLLRNFPRQYLVVFVLFCFFICGFYYCMAYINNIHVLKQINRIYTQIHRFVILQFTQGHP